MQPANNRIFFLPDKETVSFDIGGGIKLAPDDTFNPGEHQPIQGVVVGVPKALEYGRDDTLQWATQMELQVGDTAIVGFYDLAVALDDDHYFFNSEGQRVFTLRYDTVIVAIRAGEVIPCNGYCLIRSVEPQDIAFMENAERRKYKHDQAIGIVEYVGKPNRAYFYDDHYSDDVRIKKGDWIVFDTFCDLPVENKGREHLFKHKLFYIQRRHILGTIKH